MKTVPLFCVVNTPEMEAAAVEVMRSGQISSGRYVSAFENGLAELLGQPNVVTTVDMTSAIHLSLYLAGVQSGDDVLTTAFSCMSTNSAIATIGARPVWVDLAANSACIDAADFENAITPKTKAAILYHLAGYPGPVKKIVEICNKHDIVLIEDCNNALLATVDNCFVGSFADFAVYSFYPNRQVNATEGGALVCKNKVHAIKARQLRRFGIDTTSFRDKTGEISGVSDIPEVGWSIALNNMCSAIGYTQLQSVAERVRQSRENAETLIRRLIVFPELFMLNASPEANPVYWVLLLKVDCRDAILENLKSQGVQASKLHQRNDIYSCFTSCARDLPNTTEFQRTVVALPVGWWLSENDIDNIVSAMKNALTEVVPPPLCTLALCT
jgi:perosamine synthetase